MELPSPKKIINSSNNTINNSRSWKRPPDALANNTKATRAKTTDINNNDVISCRHENRRGFHSEQEAEQPKDEVDLLLEGLTEDEILELAGWNHCFFNPDVHKMLNKRRIFKVCMPAIISQLLISALYVIFSTKNEP